MKITVQHTSVSNVTTTKDITNVVESVTWSGSATEASRSLEISMLNAPYNPESIPVLYSGDIVRMYHGKSDGKNVLRFLGRITTRERIGEKGTLTYTATDYMKNVLESKITKKYKNRTAKKIAQDACTQVKLKTGTLCDPKVKIKKLYATDESVYQIILQAYYKAYKETGIKYFLRMNGTKLEVIQRGQLVGMKADGKSVEETFVIKSITESKYSETIDGMVNKVAIYNKKNKKIGSVSNASWVKAYGTYQNTLTVESGTGKSKAKNMLVGKTKSASISCLGNIGCVAGKGVLIYDKTSNLLGEFWISSDTHTFQNGKYTMELELDFKNAMEKPDTSGSSSKSSSSSVSTSSNSDADKLVAFAKKFKGKVKYTWGGSRPDLGRADCSGYTMYVFKHALGISLPHNARTQANYGYKTIHKISSLKKGDLMFFTCEAPTIDHVGIYIGDKKLIQVWNNGCEITSVNLPYIRKHWNKGRRIIK